MGENLIGACQKGHNLWHACEEPDLRSVFIDINTGNVVLTLSSNLWINEGFKNGFAIVESTDRDYFKIDKKGKLYKIKTKRNYCSYLEPEQVGDPFIDEYNDDEIDCFYGMTDGMEGDLW